MDNLFVFAYLVDFIYVVIDLLIRLEIKDYSKRDGFRPCSRDSSVGIATKTQMSPPRRGERAIERAKKQ